MDDRRVPAVAWFSFACRPESRVVFRSSESLSVGEFPSRGVSLSCATYEDLTLPLTRIFMAKIAVMAQHVCFPQSWGDVWLISWQQNGKAYTGAIEI